ncbi:MAG TPA: hypothetical protein VL357_06240 [Rariglobus sp.]|jgi:hypothetical protein|nr:hypothetical protein [Rariglobus sp.]
MKPSTDIPLRTAIARAFVIAHREDTSRLEAELRLQGIKTHVLRQDPDPHILTFSAQMRCLLNHANAWKRAAESEGLTLFIEADFVPCRGFGGLSLPFDPSLHGELAWCYLYAGGPRIYSRLPSGHFLAHACGCVAYVMPPKVARLAHIYTEELRIRHPEWNIYHPWDTEIQWYLMGDGARAFIPRKQFGEHGGHSNPEHAYTAVGRRPARRLLARAGIGVNHHADSLAAPLAFLPNYSRGRRLLFWRTRAEGRATGMLRFFCGKMACPLGKPPLIQRLSLIWHCAWRVLV